MADGVPRHIQLMGNEDHRFPGLIQFGKNLHHVLCGFAVQIARRFIRHDDGRIIDERPGDGHALPLPAGKFIRHVVDAVSQAEMRQDLHRALPSLAAKHIPVDHGQDHIIRRGQPRQQIEALKYEADLPVSRVRQLIVRKIGHFAPVQLIRALRRAVKTAENIHERGLPRAGRPHDGYKFPFFHSQIDVCQNGDFLFADVIAFPDVRHPNDGAGRFLRAAHDQNPGPRRFDLAETSAFSCETVPLTTIWSPAESPERTSAFVLVVIPVSM